MARPKKLDMSDLAALGDLSILSKPGLPVAEGSSKEIALDLIDPDPDQPRKSFDPELLNELAASIKAEGVVQPISVSVNSDDDSRYLIIFGERRWRASKLAGKKTIPCLINERNEIVQYVENVHRDDLKIFEHAEKVAGFLSSGLTQAALAKKIGKPQSWVSKLNALFLASDFILALSEKGFCSDLNALGFLVAAHKNHPAEVEAFCLRQRGSVSRSDVNAFVQSLHVDVNVTGTAKVGEAGKPASSSASASQALPVLHFKQPDGSVLVAKLADCFILGSEGVAIDLSSVSFSNGFLGE